MGNVEMSLLEPEKPGADDTNQRLFLWVKEAINMPIGRLSTVSITISKRSQVNPKNVELCTIQSVRHEKHTKNFVFDQESPLDLGHMYPEDVLDFSVYECKKRLTWTRNLLGTAEWRVRNLVHRPSAKMTLNGSDDLLLLGKDRELSFLEVAPCMDNFPQRWPRPSPEPDESYPHHIMLITRGTRGDIQPFVALAEGLANILGWKVTICSEMRYKDKIKKAAKPVTSGRIQFRPSGGDTSKKIESTVSKMAMNSKSDTMQALMLSRSEVEFFGCEPAVFYWAKTMRPDVMIYGFTVASVAMVCSEALSIPAIGFILQPTVLHSVEYDPVVRLNHSKTSVGRKLRNAKTSHHGLNSLKMLMENFPLGTNLRKMRSAHSLPRIPGGVSIDLLAADDGSPVLVPINEDAFGGRPADWPETAEFTDFIFQADQSVTGLEPLYADFIRQARDAGRPLVLMAFSSMPVPTENILSTACLIAELARPDPAVIAMLGAREPEPISSALQRRVDQLKANGQLLEGRAAPFNLLLPEMDCNIIHGGLGTTAEALRAGKPILVTGTLLMDQRFWGAQMCNLRVGPGCCHIDEFDKYAVPWVTEALRPDNEWLVNAQEMSRKMGTLDGVELNARAMERVLQTATPFNLERAKSKRTELQTQSKIIEQKPKRRSMKPMRTWRHPHHGRERSESRDSQVIRENLENHLNMAAGPEPAPPEAADPGEVTRS